MGQHEHVRRSKSLPPYPANLVPYRAAIQRTLERVEDSDRQICWSVRLGDHTEYRDSLQNAIMEIGETSSVGGGHIEGGRAGTL